MANKISTIVDFDTTASKAKLSDFKSAIQDADGAGAKMKAGFGAAKDAIVANAGALAIGAGAALVAFGAKAVGAFTEVSKAAIDLSTATGLSIEEASRWLGVADDYQVSAEALQTGLGKIAKTLDDTKWSEYGIATRDAGGNARPVNAILLDTLQMLSGITNKTEQAAIGQKLFGKGYQSLTPILGHTREEYEKMLGAVEKGQVITEEEAAKAEKWRLAQDQLNDAIHEVTLALGGIIAGGAPVITFFADAVTKTIEWRDALDSLTENTSFKGFFGSIADNAKGVTGAFTDMKQKVSDVFTYGPFAKDVPDAKDKTLELAKAADVATVAADGTAAAFVAFAEKLGVAAEEEIIAKQNTDALARATEYSKKQIDDLKSSVDEATGSVGDYELAVLETADQMDDLATRTAAADEVVKSSKATDVEKAAALRDVRQAQIDMGAQVDETAGKFVAESGAVEGTTGFYKLQRDKLIEMQKQYPMLHDEIQKYIDILNAIPGVVNTEVNVHTPTGKVRALAGGGDFNAGDNLIVGENGPEFLHAGSGGHVTPNDQIGGAGGDTFVINMPVGINDRDLMRALQKLKARNGPAFLVS